MLTIALIILVLLAGVVAIASTRPDSFVVQRSAVIAAPPEAVFPLIADLHGWSAWSPYEAKDPAMKKTYGGAPSGVGAVYQWDGNNKVGKGRMEVMEVVPPTKVAIKLDFERPFKGHNIAEFALQPQDGGTRVTWSMRGASPLVARIMGLVIDMDRMIGRDFETGLATLKTLAER